MRRVNGQLGYSITHTIEDKHAQSILDCRLNIMDHFPMDNESYHSLQKNLVGLLRW